MKDLKEMLTDHRAAHTPSEQAFVDRFIDGVPGMCQDAFGNRYLRLGEAAGRYPPPRELARIMGPAICAGLEGLRPDAPDWRGRLIMKD